jgi:NADP-dependent 3-hydroxy acid dehydrogenase YdfG
VETEFSRVRFGGDEQREAAVYERVTLLSTAARPYCVTLP